MSHKALRRFLQNIERDKPINLPRFYALIKGLNLNHRFMETDISAEKEGLNAYLVTNIDKNLKSELMRLVADISDNLGEEPLTPKASNRIRASRQNQSHGYKVMGSFLLLQQDDNHPQVITFNADGNYSLPKALVTDSTYSNHPLVASTAINDKNDSLRISLSKDALLLENRQLFLQSKRTVEFLQRHTPFASENFDIIFSAGNEISNSLHRAFLTQYQHLYCCFDIDLGGLTTANNLMRLLPSTACELLIPDDIDERLANVVERVSSEYVHKVRSLANVQPRLANAAEHITIHHKVLEQESFLYD